ncbi:ATP-binding cassette domain-containing protein [Streptomyces sp. NPDC005438]|uniref:ABC transporter ATP-binding protein n=1 Tax=Streptomyces sp. NPDC005438 TaxID=3156880 RepID=UPI0033B22EA8
MSDGTRLEGVGRRYGLRGPWVLRDVDLTVPPGRLLRIEGDNGSGKSTLLRLIAGIDAPNAGRVLGRPRRSAYVPERFPASLPFTALEYLTHLGRVHGLGRAVVEPTAREWLERLGAGQHAGTPLTELSKGSRQKVAVAQALLAAPELLVLDEAWTGLDQEARAVLEEAVTERLAARAAVVFVDHEPRRLSGVVHTAYRVRRGQLDQCHGDTTRPEPRTTVEAAPPHGAPPPERLPWPSRPLPGGRYAFTVASARSDELLRTLLTARPPWHVHAVRPPAPERPEEDLGS